MGKRGPAPLPTKIRQLHGDSPYRINATEPTPRSELPEPPAWLGDDARAVWERTVDQLAAMDMAHRADQDTLVGYCCAVVNYARSQQLVDRSSVVMAGGRAGLMGNPASREARQWADIVVRYAREFGLTPSARVNLHTEREPEDARDLAARLLS